VEARLETPVQRRHALLAGDGRARAQKAAVLGLAALLQLELDLGGVEGEGGDLLTGLFVSVFGCVVVGRGCLGEAFVWRRAVARAASIDRRPSVPPVFARLVAIGAIGRRSPCAAPLAPPLGWYCGMLQWAHTSKTRLSREKREEWGAKERRAKLSNISSQVAHSSKPPLPSKETHLGHARRDGGRGEE